MSGGKQLSEKRQLALNLLAAVTAVAFNFGVTFFLSPWIVRSIGTEANGFIQLANNFVSYATLVTIALNSMAGRFITISVARNDLDGARKYYTATLFGNMALSLVLLILTVACVVFLDKIINVSPELANDVKILFAFIFANFIIGTTISVWSVSTFIKNKLYLDSLRNMESRIINGAIILTAFTLFAPRVYYVGIAAFVSTGFLVVYNFHYKRTLLPEISAERKYFSFKTVRELVSSGIWNSILQCGHLLLSGLDLLIANLYISAEGMGILALAKMFPTLVSTFAGTITRVFVPNLTIEYAKGDMVRLKKELDRGMKLTEIFITIPLPCFIVFGKEFYTLWLPGQDASLLQALSVVSCLGLVLTSGIQCLFTIFTVVNKVKENSIVLLIDGVLTMLTALVLLRVTPWGLFVIAGTSTVYSVIKNMLFDIPLSAKYLGLKKTSFYPQIAYSAFCVGVILAIGFAVRQIITIDSWVTFVISVAITAVIGVGANLFIVLNKSERRYFYAFVKRRLKK